jgi:hypothetical protein
MGSIYNVAFNGNGSMAVVVGHFREFAVLEIGRNETN